MGCLISSLNPWRRLASVTDLSLDCDPKADFSFNKESVNPSIFGTTEALRPSHIAHCPMTILDLLPNELLTKIISHCNVATKSALCQVSKEFKQLAHRPLYEIVNLNEERTKLFTRTLDVNPEYGVCVKELRVSIYYSDRFGTISKTTPVRILQRTTELRHLSVTWHGSFESSLSFPHLQTLNLKVSDWDSDFARDAVLAFLNRHPALLHLNLYFHPSQIEPVIDLPNLVSYRDRSLARARMLLKTDSLRSVWFRFYGWTDEKSLDAFSKFPFCQDVVIEVQGQISPVQIVLKRLKHALPNLKCCVLKILCANDSEVCECLVSISLPVDKNQDARSTILEEISGFGKLESFGLILYSNSETLSAESITQSWVEKCPTLQECFIKKGSRGELERYKVVDHRAEPTVDPCRIENVFDFISDRI
ncbi:hypothetical protein C8J56DRAFT_954150 [Mycena floridula]|nr:hypothetical protein C8J56DRAFT_954150 [Mycena floridula]